MKNLKQKVAVAAVTLAPLAAFAQGEPFDATFTTLGTKAGLVVAAAWVLFGATRVPGLIMKIASKFMSKAS